MYDFCTTVSEEPQFLYDCDCNTHTQNHTTMGDIGHGLCRRPWQSTAGSSATRVLSMLWPMLGMLGLFFSPEGVSSVTFFTSARESNFFPNTGDVRHRLCRHLSLSVAQLGTTFLIVR